MISKVLAGRLGEVMDSIISSSQSAFIKKRHIADGVVVINEVIDLAKKSGKECLFSKLISRKLMIRYRGTSLIIC